MKIDVSFDKKDNNLDINISRNDTLNVECKTTVNDSKKKIDAVFLDNNNDLDLNMSQDDLNQDISFGDVNIIDTGNGKIDDVVVKDGNEQHSVVKNRIATIDITNKQNKLDNTQLEAVNSGITQEIVEDIVDITDKVIKYIPKDAYTASEFIKNEIIEYQGRVYLCKQNVVGLDDNKPDTDTGSIYWKPLNSTNKIGENPLHNCVEGDIWFDTNN